MILSLHFVNILVLGHAPNLMRDIESDLTKKIWFAHQLVDQIKKRPILYSQYSISQNKGNYGFYGVIILRKLPGQCPNLESSRKTFSMRRNLAINWRRKFSFYLPQKYFPKLQYDGSKLFGKVFKQKFSIIPFPSRSRIRNKYILSFFSRPLRPLIASLVSIAQKKSVSSRIPPDTGIRL